MLFMLAAWLTGSLAAQEFARPNTPPDAAQATPPALRKGLTAAAALAEQGQMENAAEQLSELSRIWPGRPEPLLNLAALASRQQDYSRARVHLEAALRTSPAHARAYDQLQQLNAEMARQAYSKALNPGSAQVGSTVLPWTATADDDRGVTPGAAGMPGSTAPSAPATLPMQSGQEPTASMPAPIRTPADSMATAEAHSSNATVDAPTTLARWLTPAALALLLTTAAGAAWAQHVRTGKIQDKTQVAKGSPPTQTLASPEARLIDIYRLIGGARLPEALAAAEALARDTPRFALAQVVYGDLLIAQTGTLDGFGQGLATASPQAGFDIQALRREAALRLNALRELPPPGTWPRQVLQLAPSARHLLAVDTSRSRLYVIENQPSGPRLIAHHYVSIGAQGVGKRDEGDQRTPLGVYYLTSRLDGKQLGDFYGAGALPLNYPNDHDRRMGRTGANIWLHGTPSAQYARAPRATNGCIVMANDDLARWLRELAPRVTPVVIAEHLDWVNAKASGLERQTALALTESWRRARVHDDAHALLALYAQHFDNGEVGFDAWREQLQREAQATHGRERQLDDLSVLSWHEGDEVLVVTFTEVLRGSTRGMSRRQYWSRERGQWKIFSEGVIE